MKKNIFFSRRSFLKTSLQLTAGLALSAPLKSLASISGNQPMSFYHTHTGERLRIDFSSHGCLTSALNELNTFLRDFRTGDIHSIDPALLNTLYGIQQLSGSQGDIEIISGYRSPKTNSNLRKLTKGVAKRSLHMKGQALDIRITDLKTCDLRDIAISLRQGGVGYYSKSNFVHIDTGRVRFW